jgi:hypothetical protein
MENAINKIITVFRNSINPTIRYNHQTNRDAAEDLIEMFGAQRTVELAEMACAIFGKPYAPVITTPYQLREKLAQLQAYAIRHQSKRIVNID